MKSRRPIASVVLLVTLLAVGVAAAAWKHAAKASADAEAAAAPEPAETVTVATARAQEHRRTSTSIGTVLALQSVTLRNEVPGTVKQVALTPGQIVEPGTLLVALDVSVEEAELRAFQAQAELAQIIFNRVSKLGPTRAASGDEVDRARTELDVARANIERVKAVIARKTIRAPFRARVGLADVHVGQYLEEGTVLTTLQGVEDAVHVDFTAAQRVAAGLRVGDTIEVFASPDAQPIAAKVVAVDARVDPATRNATVRARIPGGAGAPAPGASVRVRVPVGEPTNAVAVPATAMRKGPEGDYVFIVGPAEDGKTRARVRTVRSGQLVGEEVLVHAGLKPGEQVAASGSFKLRDSALVNVAPDQVAAAAPATK